MKRLEQDHYYIASDRSDTIDFNEVYYSHSNPIYNIPVNKLRNHGGQAYSKSQHHFIMYYQDGLKVLERYYRQHNPKNIFEKHFIFDKTGEQRNLPWRSNNHGIDNGEHGLPKEHGHSAYGPVSGEKLKLEKTRLDHCYKSIKSNGYILKKGFPKKDNGFPRGYFLISNSGDWVFIVIGGKHRVAAMTFLGWSNIPIQCEGGMPRCIFERDINKWPGIISAEYTSNEAKLIFDSYFRDLDLKVW